MQLLAEHGPQNLEQAFMYFKHWVKGRPLSDAVALPARFDESTTRSDFGRQMPDRMHDYDPTPNDRQPGVLASDPNAYNAAVAKPGSAPVPQTTESQDRNIEEARTFRARLEDFIKRAPQRDLPSKEVRARDDAADVRDIEDGRREAELKAAVKEEQQTRQQEMVVPGNRIVPAYF